MSLVLLAYAAPLLPGLPWMLAALGRSRDGAGLALLLGGGWVLGAAMLAAVLQLLGGASAPGLAFAALPWLLAVAAAGVVAAWVRRHHRMPPVDAGRRGGWWWLLLGLLVLHLLLASHQALGLPTVPWDAWTTWVGRARGWWDAGELAPFLGPAAWAADPGAARATLAPHYPEALPRLLVFAMSAHGRWSEAVAHGWWPVLALAAAAAAYGLQRRLGLSPRWAMAGCFAAFSLPLANAHLALAGYADLWIAALVMASGLHLALALRDRDLGDLAVGLGLALALPLFKLEGAVWLLVLVAAAAWAWLPGRWRLLLPLAATVVLAVTMAVGRVLLPLPGLGVVELDWGQAVVPGVGQLDLFWRPVGDQVASALLALPNWHLLAWLVPVLLVLGARGWWRDAGLRLPALAIVLGALFLGVLFFFTDASAWAENLTSVNRVLLHLALLAAVWMVAMAERLVAVREGASAARLGPAPPQAAGSGTSSP